MKGQVDLRYCEEKLSIAVRDMAMSGESLQIRLAHAFIYRLGTLEPETFGVDLGYRFESILMSVSKRPAKDSEGTILATTSEMTNDEASHVIGLIVDLWDLVSTRLAERSARSNTA
jgi:hypothetical protein